MNGKITRLDITKKGSFIVTMTRAELASHVCRTLGHSYPSLVPACATVFCRRCGAEAMPPRQRPYPPPYARRVPGYPQLWEDTQ